MNDLIPIAAILVMLGCGLDLYKGRNRKDESAPTLRKVNLIVIGIALVVLVVYIVEHYFK
jgi:hypothetical protein